MLRWSPLYFSILLGRNLPEYAIIKIQPKVFSVSYPRRRSTSEVLSLFTKVATTNHFELEISAIPDPLKKYIQKKDNKVSNYFIQRELGLLCKGADIPGATFATAQVSGNYMGIQQKYAHTRIFTESSFNFIVDDGYRVIKFFELWQEYIASGGETALSKRAFYTRMQFPDNYKMPIMRLTKFDKDHFQKVTYSFINAFPINIVPTSVSYENNRVLEITVTFNYDRYVLGEVKSLEGTDPTKEQPTGNGEYKNDTKSVSPSDTNPNKNSSNLIIPRGQDISPTQRGTVFNTNVLGKSAFAPGRNILSSPNSTQY